MELASDIGGLDSGTLKKGPWTSAEDAILVSYVTRHGEGNWNSVQKHSGLFRCGKSCRLRWANHLRPNLRKGAFTPEEERTIVELHAKLGNKWARMAAQVITCLPTLSFLSSFLKVLGTWMIRRVHEFQLLSLLTFCYPSLYVGKGLGFLFRFKTSTVKFCRFRFAVKIQGF